MSRRGERISVDTTITATTRIPTPTANPLVNPWTTAARDRPPCAAAYDAVALVAIVLRNATPSEPPTCCIGLTNALAAPASGLGTPSNAGDASGPTPGPIPSRSSSTAGPPGA